MRGGAEQTCASHGSGGAVALVKLVQEKHRRSRRVNMPSSATTERPAAGTEENTPPPACAAPENNHDDMWRFALVSIAPFGTAQKN